MLILFKNINSYDTRCTLHNNLFTSASYYHNTSFLFNESQVPSNEDTTANNTQDLEDNTDEINSLKAKNIQLEQSHKQEIIKLQLQLSQATTKGVDSKEQSSSNNDDDDILNNKNKNKDNDLKYRSLCTYKTEILGSDLLAKVDFILITQSSQDDANSVFNFMSNQKSKFTIPDNQLNHIKSLANKEILVNISYLTQKLLIWDKIYKLYFKSIFKLISKLKPVSNKYFKDLNTVIITQDSLRLNPALNMLYDYQDSVSKIVYGYANGLHEMTPFLGSRYHKINIDYEFKNDPEKMSSHRIKVTWYEMINEVEKKFSASANVIDSPYEFKNVQTPFSTLNNNSMYNNDSQRFINSTIYDMSTTKFEVNPLQDASSTRQSYNFNNTSGPNSAVNVQGFTSRMIVNGEIYLDFSDSTIFNSLSSLIYIDHLGIESDNISESTQIQELLIYIGAMIQHFAISKIHPSDSKIKDIICNINIDKFKDLRNPDQLHQFYKRLVNQGDIVPITPVQFDYYFYENTIKSFSEYSVLSSISNVTINSDLHTVLPYMDKTSRINFRNYARNRSLLSSSTYLPKYTFDFQKLNHSISFEDMLVEMYIKTMLISTVPEYIPLITRGDWGHENNRSLVITTSYINDNFIKFNLNDTYNKLNSFISDIICNNNENKLDSVFKQSTRLTKDCPSLFSRFLLWQEVIEDSSIESQNIINNESYLSNNKLDE